MKGRAAVISDERLLTFEVGGAIYALPIGGVLEVAEVGTVACVPSLAPGLGGVINYHGDALPVLERSVLLDLEEGELAEPEHVLVISGVSGRSAQLGLPVDRVLGLVAGSAPVAHGPDPVAARRPIGGRVAGVLDPERLVARAREVIDGALARGG